MAFRTKFLLGKQRKEETVHVLSNLSLEFHICKGDGAFFSLLRTH
jgi:hypothetical protein